MHVFAVAVVVIIIVAENERIEIEMIAMRCELMSARKRRGKVAIYNLDSYRLLHSGVMMC